MSDGPRARPGCRKGSRQARWPRRQTHHRKVGGNLPRSQGRDLQSYEFADRTSPPFASLRNLHTDFDFGATHVNEVQYLFKHFGLDSPLNAEQRVLSRQMVQYWGSFVRDGVPRAAGQPVMPGRPGTVLALRTASAGGNTPSTTVHEEHRCDLWDADMSG
ncbi:carboxylesterase family protein [Streptomyces sp. NPDC002088]|uniref:carboxylesterase family protein n=1 Tax=Streptomyces sp. NPDC002088 TaxID=3154665 RepID=UPI00332841E9